MAVTNASPKTFTAGEALEAYCQVKLHSTAGEVVYADAGDGPDVIGVTLDKVASGEKVAVQLKNAGGTFKIRAAAAILAHAELKGANDGKVTAVGTTSTEPVAGRALEAASGDGAVIEVYLYGDIQVTNLDS